MEEILQPAKSVHHYCILNALLCAASAQNDLWREAKRNGFKHSCELHARREEEAKSAFEALKCTLSKYDSDMMYGYLHYRNAVNRREMDAAKAAAR